MNTTLELCPTPEGRKRWSRQDVDFLEKAGLLPGHYELLDGEIISKMGQNLPHSLAVMRVIAYLLRWFATDVVRTQSTMEVRADDRVTNLPEPDVVALREMGQTIPTGEDVLLAVEVSDTTLSDDINTKAHLYARAGVAEYWVLDLNRRVLVAFRERHGDGWLSRTEYGPTDAVAPLAAPAAAITVSELLPPETAV